MSDTYVVAVDGLEQLRDILDLPEAMLLKARQAINTTARRTRAAAAKEIRKQVDFPARYLSDSQNGRLSISQYASQKSLEAKISGRERPTSLARFARGTPESTRKAGGVSVGVKPGSSKWMGKAFLIRLPQGSTLTDTQYNLGLAMRLKPGESIQNKKFVVKMGGGLYILYGPSVNQVFREVAEDAAPEAADFLEKEFVRLLGV